MSITLCLLGLSAGYWVFLSACKEKEGLKVLGQTIGVVVMGASLLTSLCCLATALKYKSVDAGSSMMCPVQYQPTK